MKLKKKLLLVGFLGLIISMPTTVFAADETSSSSLSKTESVSDSPSVNENNGGQAKTTGKIKFTTEEKTVESSKKEKPSEEKQFFKVLPKTGENNHSFVVTTFGLIVIFISLVVFKRRKVDA